MEGIVSVFKMEADNPCSVQNEPLWIKSVLPNSRVHENISYLLTPINRMAENIYNDEDRFIKVNF